MSTIDTQAPAPAAINLPPATRVPKALQGAAFSISRRWAVRLMAHRHGDVFMLNVPVYGPITVVANPQLAKQVFTTSPEVLGNIQPNLSRLLGSGSVFALDGDEHRQRRRLLAPPFHGKSIKNYENIIEEETLREIAAWPEATTFATLPSTMRITLNAILRAVFGAEGAELDELRRILPPWVTLGSRMAIFPKPKRSYGRYTPWGRLAEWRRQFDVILDKLIENERADPNLEDRTDVLALMLRSAQRAETTDRHVCSDAGVPVYFIKIGTAALSDANGTPDAALLGRLAAEIRAEPHHHRLRNDETLGEIEIGPHFLLVDLQAGEHEFGLAQRAGGEAEDLR